MSDDDEGVIPVAVAVRWECPCGFSTTRPLGLYDPQGVEDDLKPHLAHLAQDWQKRAAAAEADLRELRDEARVLLDELNHSSRHPVATAVGAASINRLAALLDKEKNQ